MNAFLRYIGAKHRLAGPITDRLLATGRPCLVEVFGGSAAVMLRGGFVKRVYNDADEDLVNLYRVMADPVARPLLLKILRWSPPSRAIYDTDYKTYLRGCSSFRLIRDPVDRARATFYRQAFAFGGKMRSGGFQVSATGRREIKEVQKYRNTLRRFSEVGAFFRNTVIENLDFQDCIRIYGWSDDNVLFVDPPYMGTEEYYSHAFTTRDHVYLAQMLVTVPAPTVCTFYDCQLVRQLYPESHWTYESESVVANSSNTRGSKKRVMELILTKKMPAAVAA